MQQTQKYKFNLPNDQTDRFSADPLNENFEKVERELDALDAAKAEKTALDAGLAALAGRVGTLETDRLLWTFGSYTGDGTFGKDHPTRIEFPFKPLVVIVVDTVEWMYGSFVWLYGQSYGKSYVNTNAASGVVLKWEDRAIEFYTAASNTYSGHQLNFTGRKYKYFALGIDE